MKNNIVVTFTGMAGSGKDTFVKMVKESLNELFAVHAPDYLEECLRYMVDTGLDVTTMSFSFGDFLKSVCARNFDYTEENKAEKRHLLQFFGTDLARSSDDSVWIYPVTRVIDCVAEQTPCRIFFITDARFENEIYIDDMLTKEEWGEDGNYLNVNSYTKLHVYIKGIDHRGEMKDSEKGHSSEAMASNPNINMFTNIITNDSTLEYLKKESRFFALRIIEILLNEYKKE